MTQVDRVLAALRTGPVNTADFLAPNVCDGQKPIIRLAARVHDLQAQGYRITTRRRMNQTVDYELLSEASGAARQDEGGLERTSAPVGPATVVSPQASLFDPSSGPRNAALEDWENAA